MQKLTEEQKDYLAGLVYTLIDVISNNIGNVVLEINKSNKYSLPNEIEEMLNKVKTKLNKLRGEVSYEADRIRVAIYKYR